MKEPLVFTDNGIKCDNDNCDWFDDNITFPEMEGYIDHPCPKCGDNVLTQGDYNNLIRLKETVEMVNNMSEEELESMMSEFDKYEPFTSMLDGDPNALYSMKVNTHNGINIESIDKIDTSKRNFTFVKDPDGRWYIDLPSWTGDRADLEMVCGADDFLNDESKGENSVTLCVSEHMEGPDLFRFVFEKIEETPEIGGAVYTASSMIVPYNMWLCDVTKFVFGGYLPQNLYIY